MDKGKNDQAQNFTPGLHEIVKYLRADARLATLEPKIKDFNALSPHYGRWVRVTSIVVFPKEETADVHKLSNMLNGLALGMHPKSKQLPYTNPYTCKMVMGMLTFDEPVLTLINDRSVRTRFSVSADELGEGAFNTLFNTLEAANFDQNRPAGSLSGELARPQPKPEVILLNELIQVHLLPTRALAEEASGKGCISHQPRFTALPIHIRKDAPSPERPA